MLLNILPCPGQLPFSPPIKNHLSPDVSCVTIEKPYLRAQVLEGKASRSERPEELVGAN